MGVAASFDVKLAQLNGMVIRREARALAIDVSLGRSSRETGLPQAVRAR